MLFVSIIIIGIMLGIIFYLHNKLQQKVEEDTKTSEYNKLLQTQKNNLEENVRVINNLVYEKTNELNLKETDISNLNQRIEEKQKQVNQLSDTIKEHQQISEDAFQQYFDTLNKRYDEVEKEFDDNVAKLREQQTQIVKELDKMCQTRTAAHEALLKEIEVKENKDNYMIQLSELEKRDIKILNSIKKELINERPVNMIIWQSYYSKKANELCSRILGVTNKIGIYKITQLSTNKCYIGQSKNIKERLREHMKCGLGIDTPSGNKLYQAMLENSLDDFTFEMIEECDANSLNEKEKYYIEFFCAYDYGFNSNRGVSK